MKHLDAISKQGSILLVLLLFLFSYTAFAQQEKKENFVFEDIPGKYGIICQFSSIPEMADVLSLCRKYTPREAPGKNNLNTVLFRFLATSQAYSFHMVIHSGECEGNGIRQFNWAIQDEGTTEIIGSGNVYNRKINGLIVGHSYLVSYNWESTCNDNSIYPYIISNSESGSALMAFSAEQKLENIQITWSTSGESQADRFELEKGIDDKHFIKVENTSRSLEKNGRYNYNCSDIQTQSGTNYYRIKHIKPDGEVSYSKTAAVNYMKKEDQIKVFPSVVKNEMLIKYYAEQKDLIILRITDVNGSVVLSQPITAAFEGLNVYDFSPENIKPGTYTANLMRSDRTIVTRFTKQ